MAHSPCAFGLAVDSDCVGRVRHRGRTMACCARGRALIPVLRRAGQRHVRLGTLCASGVPGPKLPTGSMNASTTPATCARACKHERTHACRDPHECANTQPGTHNVRTHTWQATHGHTAIHTHRYTQPGTHTYTHVYTHEHSRAWLATQTHSQTHTDSDSHTCTQSPAAPW